MPSNDVCDEIAAILHPMPTRDQLPDEVYDVVCMEVERERQRTAADLRVLWEVREDVEQDADPLLASLARLYGERTDAETGIRRLLAYAREFTRPKPYPLTDLADAVGMSFSGVRTAYSTAEVDFVARQIGRRPRNDRGGDGSTKPRREGRQP